MHRAHEILATCCVKSSRPLRALPLVKSRPMPVKLGWVAVRVSATQVVLDALREVCTVAKKEDIPVDFRVFDPPRTSKLAFWKKTHTPWVVALLGSHHYSAIEWAQALSVHLNVPAVGFFVSEGGWSYSIFDGGSEVVALEHLSAPPPVLVGDRARASSLLDVDVALIERYVNAWGEEHLKPFPGDEFLPTNEWAHIDFARHLGIIYPNDPQQQGKLFAPGPEMRMRAPEAWQGLPKRLEAEPR